MRNKWFFVVSSVILIGTLAGCSTGAGATVAASQGLTSQAGDLQPEPADQNPVSQSIQSDSSTLRTISVDGDGKVMVSPDIAYINIGVHSEDADASKALNENNTQAQAVIDALTGSGVAAADIQTSNFNIYPYQQYNDSGEVSSTIYQVDNTVYVTVRDLENLGSLLNTVVASGANTINGIEFDLADKSDALSQAREQAISNARNLAEETAGNAGVTLGQIVSINVSTNSTPVYYEKAMGAMDISTSSSVPISSGQITLSASVSMVFEIQ